MATKKQSSAKQSSDASAADSPALASDDINETGAEVLHVEPPAPDFAALESRVAQADAAHGAAVASVGTTADELREARAALREAKGG